MIKDQQLQSKTDAKDGRALTGSTPAGRAAEHLLNARFDVLRRAVRNLRKRGPKSSRRVHQLRVACRRAGAAIRAFEPLIETSARRPIARRLARLRRAAGGLRAADVHLALYRKLEADPRCDLGLEEMVRRTKRERREQRRQLAAALETIRPRDVDAWCRKLARRTNMDDPRPLLDLARQSIGKLGGTMQEQGAGSLDSIEQIHALRIAGKRLRYALEIFDPCFDPSLREDAGAWMVRFQDRLGLINDYDELTQSVAKRSKKAPKKRLARSLRALAEHLECARDLQIADFASWWTEDGRGELARLLRRANEPMDQQGATSPIIEVNARPVEVSS